MSLYNKIVKNPNIADNVKYYWGYQYNLADSFLVDYLTKRNAFSKGMNVCEIGCAEGGVLASFVENGAEFALGTDIAEARLDYGNIINSELNLNINLIKHNILEDAIPSEYLERFDLILLRDVIEHLENPFIALENISKMMKPNGKLYITFPPYYSAFGGHQHTLNNFIGKFPFVHYLLPDKLFTKLIKSGRKPDIAEVLRLKTIRLTPNKFLKSLKKANLKTVKDDYFLIRPVYKMKFGLPPININFIKFLPCVKNILALEAGYIVEKIKV